MDRKIPALHKKNPEYRHQTNTKGRDQPATHGIQKNQKSDKISSWAPNRQQSRLSQKIEFDTGPDTIITDKLIQLYRE